MSADRRYSEKEIASIFERATRAQEIARYKTAAQDGLTLTELQTIGSETGITPEFIAKAAASLDLAGEAAVIEQSWFGLPDGVFHTINLPGPVSDVAWERLVVDLRETFQAHGKIRQDGSLREWTNGNLKAIVEPTDTGWRLRLRTRKGEVKGAIGFGMLPLLIGLFMLVMSLTGNLSEIKPIGQYIAMAFFILTGIGFIGLPFISMPKWARTRQQQMEEVAVRYLGREASAGISDEESEIISNTHIDLLQTDESEKLSDEPAQIKQSKVRP